MNIDALPKGYEPSLVEEKWYRFWEENHLFRAEVENPGEAYSIVIPPPNVTGTLHMGHALNNTLQDILVRFKRMQGYNVLWMPGMDHAGIATQNVVERQLASEGTDRHALGRERFIERVWEWRKKYGGIILNQLKRLGASCDWSRTRFTMDEGLSKAVKEVFVTLYEQGLIYRGDYIINWCPRCQTALADLEVEHETIEGALYYINYPYANGGGSLTVATTRPETLLGDTAVAVNPKDPRHKNLTETHVLLPLLKRKLPIIFDEYVDVEFGAGALKITPAHDFNDFEIGLKHKLDMIRVMDDQGRMSEQAGKYAGQDRFECRTNILEDLKKENLFKKKEAYNHNVGHCYRCKTMIEPILSKQWFVKVAPLAEEASQAVIQGKTKIIPAVWEKSYFEWMNNIRDWCISRQIWWGHRIPAWYCDECHEITVARTTPEECTKCGGRRLRQETDVLDTWFSSALWPFSTMGWPDQAPELNRYYPTSTLVTGFDILFFWVARMMMMGLHFMGDVPFKDVYIHALVRDEEGQKMSKSKGNVIDPLVMMEQFGTDAFRFTLAALAAQGRDVRLSEKRVEGYRNFVNKIWNASRLTMMNVVDFDPATAPPPEESGLLADQWILSRVNRVTQEVINSLNEYRFNEAAGAIYQFAWHEFCDWYIEMIKPVLYGEDERAKNQTRAVLTHTLRNILKLLHPFMPFVTEEIWHKLPGTQGSIMISSYPTFEARFDRPEADTTMTFLMGIIGGIRNIRGEMNVSPGAVITAHVMAPKDAQKTALNLNSSLVKLLTKAEELVVMSEGEVKPDASATAVFEDVEIFVPLKGLIDFADEIARLTKEQTKLEKEISVTSRKLANEDFLAKAPRDVVAKEKEKMTILSGKMDKVKQNVIRVKQIMG
ncbi:MAG: valine--tRNA ligase [Deltaproteobacteria bacterium]|nr:valine--tRNA ligase [Deltaproteobacteria bacterium]